MKSQGPRELASLWRTIPRARIGRPSRRRLRLEQCANELAKIDAEVFPSRSLASINTIGRQHEMLERLPVLGHVFNDEAGKVVR